jgi:hypothetical protein
MFRKLTFSSSALLALAVSSLAPAAAEETHHLWPRFTIDAGAYQVSTSDKIKVAGEIELLGRPVDLAEDVGLPDTESVLGLRLGWAFAERHSIELDYWSLDRSGSRSIRRDIEIGGIVFPIGAEASVDFDTTSIGAAYTYWFMRHERFGLGGTFGLVYLGLDARASASAEFGGVGGSVSESTSASTDLPVPMIGLSVKGSPWHRLVLYGRASILPSVTVGDYSGSAGLYSLGADFYVWGPLALGASFDGTYYDADVEKESWDGSVDLSTNGFRFYLRAAF